MTTNIPQPIIELINTLSVISLVPTSQKLNIKTMSFSESDTWSQSFYRKYYGESRSLLVEFLKDLLVKTIATINDYSTTEYCKIIVDHLAHSRRGIYNLTITYKDDPNIVSQLNVILESLDLQLQKNKDVLNPDITIKNYT